MKGEDMQTIKKRIETAFGKKIYLLGIDQDGKNVWLEEPRWDCDWYWGFGYIEQYTNNKNPQLAKYITNHTHWNSSIVGRINQGGADDGQHIHHINESPNFQATTLTDEESWLLSELMKSFYILKETAEFYHRGSAGITTNPIKVFKQPNLEDTINKKYLPLIFGEIDDLLTPKGE